MCLGDFNPPPGLGAFAPFSWQGQIVSTEAYRQVLFSSKGVASVTSIFCVLVPFPSCAEGKEGELGFHFWGP